jgi:3-isopropylmalate/(R)-2-methylmalate dehydratase small subunit
MRGRAHVYRQPHFHANDIVPERHQVTNDETRLAQHALEDVDPQFRSRVRAGDIIVGGEDFGCGASREHAIWALRGSNISAVVARSFSRIFFRNALNNGFIVVECARAVDNAGTGDLLEIDLKNGVVRNLSKGESHTFVPFTPFAMEILEAGGLLPYVTRQTTGASSA